MPVYHDASVIVPLIAFASAIARKLRLKDLTPDLGLDALEKLDVWRQAETTAMQLQPDDIANADKSIRRLDLTLRAPDAPHIAMAHRAGADLETFDKKMGDSALVLGASIVAI